MAYNEKENDKLFANTVTYRQGSTNRNFKKCGLIHRRKPECLRALTPNFVSHIMLKLPISLFVHIKTFSRVSIKNAQISVRTVLLLT